MDRKELLLYVFIAGFALNVLANIVFVVLQPLERTVVIVSSAALILVCVLLVFYYRSRSDKGIPKDLNVFARSDSNEFRQYAEPRMKDASRLILIGTGLSILVPDPFRHSLMKRACSGQCQIEIYLADPLSPDVETRLIEEESGEIIPPIGQSQLLRKLRVMADELKRLGYPKSISMRLFANYPTFALLIIDSEYLIYPYGFQRLGNFSPVICFDRKEKSHQDVVGFLEEHYNRVKASSVSAVARLQLLDQVVFETMSLTPLAVYFVPPNSSPLYEFGTKVIGYDVRTPKNSKDSVWSKNVGSAQRFGFHLTICDALYFLNETAIEEVRSHVDFVCKQLMSFDLANIRVEPGFPNPTSISLMVEDPTGCLEILHHELVKSVYRRAVASDYTLRSMVASRDHSHERTRQIVNRYHAPYILGQFRPHFTLLTDVPAQDMSRISREIEHLFTNHITRRSIRVEYLSLMTQSTTNGKWTIKNESKLGV